VKRWQLTLLAAATALGLQACDRQSHTTVTAPTASLPDNAPLNAASGPSTAAAPADAQSAATAPQAAASSTASDPQAAASANLPTTTADTQPTTSGDNPQPPSASADPAAAAASSPDAGTNVAASTGASTSSMGAPAATTAGAGVADGTAAPTELARFFEETNGGSKTSAAPSGKNNTTTASGAASNATASGNATPATASGNSNGKADAKPQAKPGQKVSGELPTVRNPGDPQGAVLLAQRSLELPVVGIQPTRLSDMYDQGRGSRKHEAIDILAPSGTPVVAVDDGRVAKLFTSKAGGLTLYQFDREAQLAYYYAHLQGYAPTVREGMAIKRGDLIGYVGSTGNADVNAPHLHFAVFRLGNPPKWWQGEPVNPYPALSRATPADQVVAR
jgi:peptidoglycan LD-endopeptidase LytH